MKTFATGLLTLLAWTALSKAQDECSETCHMICVFPLTTCNYINHHFKPMCLNDPNSCVPTCTEQCKCKILCEGEPNFEGCVDGCCYDALIQMEEEAHMKATTTTEKPAVAANEKGTKAVTQTDEGLQQKKTAPLPQGPVLLGDTTNLE